MVSRTINIALLRVLGLVLLCLAGVYLGCALVCTVEWGDLGLRSAGALLIALPPGLAGWLLYRASRRLDR